MTLKSCDYNFWQKVCSQLRAYPETVFDIEKQVSPFGI
ncbi:hypothetical protein RB11336 [Rhodopirellula baltica SH 1]|uniref:Uncharacterized protein n=1 Tax=Rhodopirellula baltica (strain DSM 10527 / NCIMB 13988 / SH1) TaxID=243090 RepID=Q7UEH1_RHOBA|nr:hypothetical protein RB11336 [Rhodopirellula baltica SH 1]